MVLRLLALTCIVAGSSAYGSIRHYPLDPETVVTVTISVDAPTTCIFPGALAALEGVGLTTQAEGDAPVLLSYQEGNRHFSLRALKPDAEAGLNVMFKERVYALRLVTGPVGDRAVQFEADSPISDTSELLDLINRAQSEPYRVRPPGSIPVMPYRPASVTAYRNFTAVLEEVFRYDDLKALVFHVRLENLGAEPVAYDPDSFGIQLKRRVWFADAVDASGAIPAESNTHVWFVIRDNLSVTAPFSVIVATP